MPWILMILLIIFFWGLGTLMYGGLDIWQLLWETGVTMLCFVVSAAILGTMVVMGILEKVFGIKLPIEWLVIIPFLAGAVQFVYWLTGILQWMGMDLGLSILISIVAVVLLVGLLRIYFLLRR